ncbi:cytochrome P450 [Kineosporia mesophila]|uniref:Cytochrome P450 n=1 Tax=Kineosporia mesophila TaxID=566012 RepID=A0ABP7ANS1_9ACTN|nr:cytochrome P450 [Kineosporia mesophila]MCD5349378.1 cytochrome P450 [Kineosporia mesophila]
MTNTTTTPQYPMARDARCPFDPAPALHDQQEQAPLTKVCIWNGTTHWLVTRYEEQRALLADPRVSADVFRDGFPLAAPIVGNRRPGFIVQDDPEHARLRRMVTAPFAVKRIQAMRPAIQKITDDLIDDLLAGPNPADLVEAFALPVPSLVICDLLGVPYTDHEFFQQNSKTLIRLSVPPEERAAAAQNVRGYLTDLLAQKARRPGDDLLSMLVGRVEAGELTPDDAAGVGLLLLIAGHETTANMIALGTLALLQNPEQLALLRGSDDPKLVASAVEELLRYLSITHNGRRRVALEDIDIAGETIRAGEGIICPNELGNRDPRAFAAPDDLDLTRDARHHVAFGFGVHQCLGQPLARLELQVVYSTLYRRIPTLRLATTVDAVPFKNDGVVYGVYELPVAW